MAGAGKIERLERKRAEIEAALRAERSKQSAEKRRAETRQKIILGGRLQALAKTDQRAAVILDLAMQGLSENERRAFAETHSEDGHSHLGEGGDGARQSISQSGEALVGNI